MRRLFLSVAAVGLTSCALLFSAQAATVYTEDFNAAGFNGGTPVGVGDPVGMVTDRTGWDPAKFTTINSFDGWTFSGSTFYVTDTAGTNGAVYINEPDALALHLQNLPSTPVYSLTFTYWGDNRPISYTKSQAASTYDLFVYVNGVQVGDITDYDREPGSNAGTIITLSGLSTDLSGNFNLSFSQGTAREASPIIDDIVIANNLGDNITTPLPAAVWMMGSVLAGGAGFSSWRRRRKAA